MSEKKSWYALRVAPEGQVSEVEIFDEIGYWGISAEQFRKDFLSVVTANNNQIRLLINSPGGGIFDGMTIYNTVAEYRDRVTVDVVGLAASMASIIALAGSRMTMWPGTFYMIHNPWTLMIGNSDDLRKEADLLDVMRDEMVKIYASKSGISEDEIRELMSAETWLTGAEAKAKGFADEVKEEGKAAACAFSMLTKFKRVPSALTNEISAPVGGEENPQAHKPDQKEIQNMDPKDKEQQAQGGEPGTPEIDKIVEMAVGRMAPMFAGMNRKIEGATEAERIEAEAVADFRQLLKTKTFKGALTSSDVLVPVTIQKKIFERVSELSILRQAGVRIDRYGPGVQKVPVLPAPNAAVVLTEGNNYPGAGTTPTAVPLEARKIGSILSATEEAVTDSGYDILDLFIRDTARMLAKAENNYFLNGNTGATPAQPQGVLLGGTKGKDAAATGAITADELIDLFFAQDSQFMDKAFWVVSPTVLKALVKLKDGANQYLFLPQNFVGAIPGVMMGRPVYTSGYMPGFGANNKTVVLVNPDSYVWAEFGEMKVRVTENPANGNTEFRWNARADGKVLDPAGIQYLAQDDGV